MHVVYKKQKIIHVNFHSIMLISFSIVMLAYMYSIQSKSQRPLLNYYDQRKKRMMTNADRCPLEILMDSRVFLCFVFFFSFFLPLLKPD